MLEYLKVEGETEEQSWKCGRGWRGKGGRGGMTTEGFNVTQSRPVDANPHRDGSPKGNGDLILQTLSSVNCLNEAEN